MKLFENKTLETILAMTAAAFLPTIVFFILSIFLDYDFRNVFGL